MDPSLIPLGNRVLIQPETAPTMTESGLHLSEHWKPEQIGIVLAIGPTMCPECRQRMPLDFAVGDRVIFSWQVGQEIFINDGERFLMLSVQDVLAVCDPVCEGYPT